MIIVKKLKIWFSLNFLIKVLAFCDEMKIKIVIPGQEFDKADDVFRFRWKIYKEEGYIDFEDFAEQKLKDKYDKHSLNLLILKHDIPVGSARFILPLQTGLPTEKAFNLLNFPKVKIGEVSKLCIEKKYRKTKEGKKIYLYLTGEIYKFMKKNKIKYAFIGFPLFFKNLFEKTVFVDCVTEIPVGVLKPENLEERKTAKKYFEKFNVRPYLMKII